MPIDFTHEATATSWVAYEPDADFPIQNLPYAVFRNAGSDEAFRGGVAIGDQVVDLSVIAKSLPDLAGKAAESASAPTLNALFALGPIAWRALRHALFTRLSTTATPAIRDAMERALVPRADIELALPARIGDYSDFYTSYFHALNISRAMGISAGAVPASFHSIPIGYHGRVSSIGISGQQVRRPMGQSDPNGDGVPIFGPCTRLDYEVELGVYIGTGNALGSPVPLDEAESKIFGLCLLNDWSARDLQSWEMTPLGPFLSKSFATTVSPWIVTMDALAPYRVAWHREASFPQPLPYLDTSHNRAEGAIDISVALAIEPASHNVVGLAPVCLTKTSFRHQHWTIAQMVAHHTSNGCNLQPGDLLGTGTISGPTAGEAGALMELTEAGRKPVMVGSAHRAFLADGDTVILTARCERQGFAPIGFGECRGIVVPTQSAR